MGQEQTLTLDREQAHYLFGVMRLSPGDTLPVFNGRDGEFLAEVAEAGKKSGSLRCLERTRPLRLPPDLWLMFAPIKKERTDFIVEKAAELGAARILPVGTEFTQSGRINRDRLQAHAVEAAEQCGGTYVPELGEFRRLAEWLDDWPEDRHLLFCDETLSEAGAGVAAQFAALPRGPWAILIGPEGGFSEAERARLRAHPRAHAVSLGPRILRADTAAVAALGLWQAALGDWQETSG